jgi:hypothetical protein
MDSLTTPTDITVIKAYEVYIDGKVLSNSPHSSESGSGDEVSREA